MTQNTSPPSNTSHQSNRSHGRADSKRAGLTRAIGAVFAAVAVVAGAGLVTAGPASALTISANVGDATFYEVGPNACGTTRTASDKVAAIPAAMFDPQTPPEGTQSNPLCGSQVIVTRNGRSVTVTVVDRCVGCKFGDIDLSPAAFDRIAPTAAISTADGEPEELDNVIWVLLDTDF